MTKRPESVHPGFCDLNPEQRKRHEHNATWHDRWWQVYCAVLQSNVTLGGAYGIACPGCKTTIVLGEHDEELDAAERAAGRME